MKQLIEQLYADGDINQNAYIKLINLAPKTKEERFKELIEGIDISRPVVDFEKYPTSMFWFKDGKCYFEYDWKTNYFRVNWNLWKVFHKEYNMKLSDVQCFMRIWVEEHFKLRGVIPTQSWLYREARVEQHFKLKNKLNDNNNKRS